MEYSDTNLSTYINMSWDKDTDTKTYRPTGKPTNIGGVDIMALAIKADGSVDVTKTLVKSGDKIVALSTQRNSAEIIQKISE